MQEGDDRDPFTEAEEKERRRSQDAKRRHTAMPQPAQATQVGKYSADGRNAHRFFCCNCIAYGDSDQQS